MQIPEVSIIIPTYNRAELIKYTLDSLNEAYHNGVNFEVIVVDDNSTDNTKEKIASAYPKVVLLDNIGRGAAAARNTGLNAAKGKYVMYLDSDDLVGTDFFKKKIDLLNQNNEVNACYGEYESFQSDTEFSQDKIIFKHKYPIITTPDNPRQHLINYMGGNFLPPNAIIWRKELLLKIKGHDHALAINQDVDLFVRALLNGLKIVAVTDGTRVYVRAHALDNRVGDPKNARHKWAQILELRKKWYLEFPMYGYNGKDIHKAMGYYLFGYWKKLRHVEPEIAASFLSFTKEVYWPVELKGNIGYRMLCKIIGPVRTVNMKYLLLRRD